jgi:hypothetical protein
VFDARTLASLRILEKHGSGILCLSVMNVRLLFPNEREKKKNEDDDVVEKELDGNKSDESLIKETGITRIISMCITSGDDGCVKIWDLNKEKE